MMPFLLVSLTQGSERVPNHFLCKSARSRLASYFGMWKFLLILFCSQLKLRQKEFLLNILLYYLHHHHRVVMGFKWEKKSMYNT